MSTPTVNRCLTCILVLLLSVKVCQAQSLPDTLVTAKQLADGGHYKTASKLLKPYHAHHADDVNATWLYAHAAYLSKQYKVANGLFKEAMKAQPDNYNLKLDYAQMLMFSGNWDSVTALLKPYTNDHTKAGTQLLLAKTYYWQGNYKQAKAIVEQVLKAEPATQQAKDLLTEILQAESPWLKVQGDFSTDDQPLKRATPTLEAGIYFHSLSTLHLRLSAPVFIRDGNVLHSQWLQADNTFKFRKPALEINVGGGIIRLANSNVNWTGQLSISKTFKQYLVLSVGASRNPYYYTRTSLDATVIPFKYTASISWNDWNRWTGSLSGIVDHFANDHNFIYSLNIWLIAPPLKISVFEFRLGYGYGFSSAKETRFYSEKSLPYLIANFDATAKITGQYNPYFTPHNQSINSVIAAIAIHPAKTLDISLNGNIGFYATNGSPYLYLDKDKQGETVMATGYLKTRYLPVDAKATIAWHITPKLILKVEYEYTQTYFFNSHYVGLGLKTSFWK